jgi:pimeloyl-ACP methyl ester carboxylesterase
VGASLLAIALATTGMAGTASAAERGCVEVVRAKCLNVRVPLDRSGITPGTVGLNVVRFAARNGAPAGRRTAVVPIVGGPGLAATRFGGYYRKLVGKALRGRDLVLVDQRGTGSSGTLRCPSLEKVTDIGDARAAAKCAHALGPARSYYRTQDTVEDLEAVRRAVGARRLLLFGFSYGTEVALRYAAAYPRHVEGIVLDGPVAPSGVDALHTAGYRAVSRMLRGLCRRRCAGITRDPVEDLWAVASQMHDGPLDGTVIGSDGRARTVGLLPGVLFGLIQGSDQTPLLRAALPAALRSAAKGDPASLLRLAGDSAEQRTAKVEPSAWSPAAYAATACAESQLPFDLTTPDPDARMAQASARVESMPASWFAPFGTAGTASSPLVRLCLGWPADERPRAAAVERVGAPTLVLAGEADLATPPSNADEIARVAPGAVIVRVPDGGHGVLESSGCARRAVLQFLSGAARSRRCPWRADAVKPWPLPPSPSVTPDEDDLVAVASRTLWDVRRRIALRLQTRRADEGALVIIGGLRGGQVVARGRRVSLEAVEVYPGVPVSGRLRPSGVLTVGKLGKVRVDERGRVAGPVVKSAVARARAARCGGSCP